MQNSEESEVANMISSTHLCFGKSSGVASARGESSLHWVRPLDIIIGHDHLSHWSQRAEQGMRLS